jgi:transposase-like protein
MDKATLRSFYKKFPTDDACLDYLARARWPKVRICPHCDSVKSYEFKSAKLFKCVGCQKQFSARSNTIFGGSHIPVQDWFLAVLWLTTTKVPISSVGLSSELDITQKSAWLMLRRIRYARDFALPKSVTDSVDGDTKREQPFKLTGSFRTAIVKLAAAPKPDTIQK